MEPVTHTKVLRFRLKDRHAAALGKLAREVNMVWNYCNELSVKVFERERRFISGFELQKYLTGATSSALGEDRLHLHSQTLQAIAVEYATRRKQFKKVKLSWRKSGGVRRSLGWIPFKASALSYRKGQLFLSGMPGMAGMANVAGSGDVIEGGVPAKAKARALSLWDSYGLAQYVTHGKGSIGPGSFSEDARGRWYINICVSVEGPALADVMQALKEKETKAIKAVALDLGLKQFFAGSDGLVVSAQRFYRDLEPSLATSQRARKKARTRAIHAKIAARRKDFLHKLSRTLVNDHAAIFVGNVNAAGLAKTGLPGMGKSVLDAGWSTFRTMLQYKCAHAGVWFEEVNEAYSTQTCSACAVKGITGVTSRSGPKGLQGLGIREWTCTECGAHHDRDVNAAKNILARGHARLAGGIPFLTA